MGRPTCTIDRQRLRDLREEAGKTQLTIAKEIHAKLGKKSLPTDATLLSVYQRIERTGKTSRQRAEALAKIFGVTVEVLQGKGTPEPFDYLAGIASLLHKQLSTGQNEVLIRALERSAGTPIPSDESINCLAEDIGARIEVAQLARNPRELEELTKLTGLSEMELLKPANVHGHWVVIAHGIGIHSTEFVQGASGLSWRVAEIVGDRLNHRGSDASIRMYRDEPWFRLEIRRSAYPDDVIRIDWVRCDPMDGEGIRWVKASWRERFLFEDVIRTWAFRAANFVTDFDGKQSPSGDLRRLRLIVFEHGTENWRPVGRMVIFGNLDEMPTAVLEKFHRENFTHGLVVDWLKRDLKLSLAPYLAEYPRECWSVHTGAKVTIDLHEYKARKLPLRDCHMGIKYSIDLVEEVAANEYARVPWRDMDVECLRTNIEQMLDDRNDRSWAAEEPRRTFEPYVANE